MREMTNKEAIETINIAIAEVEWNYPMDYTVAFEMAIKAIEKQMKPKWNKTSEVKPTEEKQYLCCDIDCGKAYFKVLNWSNDLYEVDHYDFRYCKGRSESGFYRRDGQWGYYEDDCDYWQEIDWGDENEES